MAKEAEVKPDVNAAKLKALQATIDKIEKDYGKGTIMKLGDQPQWDVQVIPSGMFRYVRTENYPIRPPKAKRKSSWTFMRTIRIFLHVLTLTP